MITANEIKDERADFVRNILGIQDKGLLTALRTGNHKHPQARAIMYVAHYVHEHEIDVHLAVAAAIATEKIPNSFQGNLGTSIRILVRKRFESKGKSEANAPDFVHPLLNNFLMARKGDRVLTLFNNLVPALAKEQIPVNFTQLLKDLLYFEKGYVTKKWVMGYVGGFENAND
jgi:CRISPR type I-E-associated protein CasB/Cse2